MELLYLLINFLIDNWADILPIAVGCSALIIYWLQEKNKIKNASALIILQIDELQDRVREIQSYITDNGLNSTAFYEALPLMEINYWDKYKHLFIREIDNKSYHTFNKFYQYISCIQEQQIFLHNLQKNYFFIKQQSISNIEFNYIYETLKEVTNAVISKEEIEALFKSTHHENDFQNEQDIILKLLYQIQQSNPNIDVDRFWKIYNNKRNLFNIIANNFRILFLVNTLIF